MLILWGLFAWVAIVALVVTLRQGPTPVTAAIWLSSAVVLVSNLNVLDLRQVNGYAALIIGLGITSLGLASAVGKPFSVANAANTDAVEGSGPRFLLVLTAILGIVFIGFHTFVNNIVGATGHAFGQLSLLQIRAAQNGAARGGGIFALFGAATPLLACLGVYGAYRFSRGWLVFTGLSLILSLQSPSRLNSIGLILTVVTFWLYLDRTHRLKRARPLRHLRRAVLPMIGVVSALTIFNIVGSKLGKNGATDSLFPTYGMPQWTLSPIIYFTGGLSAFSVALSDSIDPYDTGSSYYAILRVAEWFDARFAAPETIGEWVYIPIPFNLYSGFGQLYFDGGLVGMIAALVFLGWLGVALHRQALIGSLSAAWGSAVMANILFALPLGFIALNLDVVFRLLLGLWAFWFMSRPSHLPMGRSSRGRSTLVQATRRRNPKASSNFRSCRVRSSQR